MRSGVLLITKAFKYKRRRYILYSMTHSVVSKGASRMIRMGALRQSTDIRKGRPEGTVARWIEKFSWISKLALYIVVGSENTRLFDWFSTESVRAVYIQVVAKSQRRFGNFQLFRLCQYVVGKINGRHGDIFNFWVAEGNPVLCRTRWVAKFHGRTQKRERKPLKSI